MVYGCIKSDFCSSAEVDATSENWKLGNRSQVLTPKIPSLIVSGPEVPGVSGGQRPAEDVKMHKTNQRERNTCFLEGFNRDCLNEAKRENREIGALKRKNLERERSICKSERPFHLEYCE